MLGILIFFVLNSVNLCKIFWPMSEACEIAQPVELKLGKMSPLFIKLICYCVQCKQGIPALDLCVYFFPNLINYKKIFLSLLRRCHPLLQSGLSGK